MKKRILMVVALLVVAVAAQKASRFDQASGSDDGEAWVGVFDNKTGEAVQLQCNQKDRPGIYFMDGNAAKAVMVIGPDGIWCKSKGESYFLSRERIAELGIRRDPK
jgi:hypothetical protein